jgi:hypothetical protein
MTEFRRVLHEWAARQLAEKSDHAGPFEITDVRMSYYPGFGSVDTPDDSGTYVSIAFRHDGTDCRLPAYLRPGQTKCGDRSWSMPDTKLSVDMLNELLAIADGDL